MTFNLYCENSLIFQGYNISLYTGPFEYWHNSITIGYVVVVSIHDSWLQCRRSQVRIRAFLRLSIYSFYFSVLLLRLKFKQLFWTRQSPWTTLMTCSMVKNRLQKLLCELNFKSLSLFFFSQLYLQENLQQLSL